MQKEIFLDMIAQNETTCWAVFNKVTEGTLISG
jgi:hypothetical protein